MKILKIKPSFAEKMWGGQGLKKFGFDIPSDKKIGEAWVISAHENGMGIVLDENGSETESLKSFFENNRNLFGNYEGDYPLLVKILTPEDYLSVQVHPNDEYAKIHHNSLGKPESWLVLDCPENAELVYGHNAKTKEEFTEMIEKGEWDDLLKKVPVKKGDFVYVGAGKVHAVTPGVMVYELQRSSDITYRFYDYDRVDSSTGKPRELHIKDSIANVTIPDDEGIFVKNADKLVYSTDFFSLFRLKNEGTTKWSCPEKTGWLQITILSGEGTINGVKFAAAESAICVDGVEELNVEGNLEVLISWIRN
jgi:mannose-6-phosphate isomerase